MIVPACDFVVTVGPLCVCVCAATAVPPVVVMATLPPRLRLLPQATATGVSSSMCVSVSMPVQCVTPDVRVSVLVQR